MILDDNIFPRQIWSYLVANKGYSGGKNGLWNTSGLSKFELAHVFGHKSSERVQETELFSGHCDTTEPYGLFTSASNVVLIPKGFAKPTDHMKGIKRCFYQRHIELYGNNGIGAFELKQEKLAPSWYEKENWRDPILPENWKVNIDHLLKYREKRLRDIYKAV